jgi:acetyl-CoA carboxylase beta subunit
MTEAKQRLIDANALLARKWDWCDAEDAIRNAPTVLAEPVRHAHWVRVNGWMKCSGCNKDALCNGIEEEAESDFCPHCGARMDEKADARR